MLSGYEDLDVYQLAVRLAVEVHRMTMDELPRFEMYEDGSQVRRSAKSIVANLVEGYGRKTYRGEYGKFLTYALASCDETKAHLELIRQTGSLAADRHIHFVSCYRELGGKLYNLREAVIAGRAR